MWSGDSRVYIALGAKSSMSPLPELLEDHVQHRNEKYADRTGRDHAAEYGRSDITAADLSSAMGHYEWDQP